MIHSAEEFVRLRTSENPVEYTIAVEQDAPISVWKDVIEKYASMKEWVVQNQTVPLEILEILASDADRKVRISVANKRKLSGSLFVKLSQDEDEVVRQRIAYNKKTPVDVLRVLTTDPVPLVRMAALARMPNI